MTIGQHAFVGTGAVVFKDIPEFALVVGNPARIIGWMCVYGNRIHFEGQEEIGICGVCSQTYRKVDQQVSPR